MTGAWCDAHYRRLAIVHPMGIYGRLLWPALMVALIVLWNLVPRWRR